MKGIIIFTKQTTITQLSSCKGYPSIPPFHIYFQIKSIHMTTTQLSLQLSPCKFYPHPSPTTKKTHGVFQREREGVSIWSGSGSVMKSARLGSSKERTCWAGTPKYTTPQFNWVASQACIGTQTKGNLSLLCCRTTGKVVPCYSFDLSNSLTQQWTQTTS